MFAVVLLVGCGDSKRMAVEDVATGEPLSSFTLHSVAGTRDGDRLHAQRSLATARLSLPWNFISQSGRLPRSNRGNGIGLAEAGYLAAQ